MTLDDLTQAVLTYSHQASPTEVSEDVLTDVRLSLYHVHLPKLASDGLATFDPDRQLVEPTGRFERVRPTLAPILDADPTLETPVKP